MGGREPDRTQWFTRSAASTATALPTGGSVQGPHTDFFAFVFDEDEELVCERVYFDQLSFLRQLVGGINLRSPRGLLTLVRVLRGFGRLSREPKDVIPDTPARTTGGSTDHDF